MSSRKVALIGAGRRVRGAYVDAVRDLQRQGVLDVVMVIDKDDQAAGLVAEELEARVGQVEGWRSSDVEGVVLAIPGMSKDRLALEVLRGGKHLFVETPAAQTVITVREMERVARANRLAVEVAEDEAFWPSAIIERERVRGGEVGRVVSVYNNCREFYYHAYARLHMLVGGLPEVSSYSGQDKLIENGGRLTKRTIRFEDGLLFDQRFVHPRDHALAKNTSWVVTGENGEIVDDFTGEDHVAGVKYLLSSWVGSMSGGKVEYGLGRAVIDIRLWQSLEVAARVPFPSLSAGVAHLSVSVLDRVKSRLANN